MSPSGCPILENIIPKVMCFSAPVDLLLSPNYYEVHVMIFLCFHQCHVPTVFNNEMELQSSFGRKDLHLIVESP